MLSRPQGTSRRTCRKDGALLLRSTAIASSWVVQGRIAPALLEQAFAGHHLGEDQAERVQVRPPIDAPDQVRGAVQQGGEVLGGRVGHRPPEDGMGGVGGHLLGHVEIQQERLPLGAEQDVRRLDIPVEDAPLMGVMEPLGQLGHDPGDRLVVAEAAQRARGVCDSAGGSWAGGSGPLAARRLVRSSPPSAGEPTASRASTSCPPRVGRAVPAQSRSRTLERVAPPK